MTQSVIPRLSAILDSPRKMDDLVRHKSSGKATQSTILGAHCGGLGYFAVMVVLVFWLEVFEVIPFLFQAVTTYAASLAMFVYGMTNIVGNYYYLIRTDTSYKKVTDTPDDEKDGFFYCQSCGQNSPPRAHHCSFCEKCVVRRDHHCFFTTTCVGHANIRFFVVFNFFVFATSAYVVVMNLFFLHYNVGPLVPLSFEAICKVIPFLTIFKWWSGSVTFFYFLVVVVTWLCLIQVMGCFGCFFFQLTLIFSEQTTYEWRHGIVLYDRGWKRNFLDLCGSLWYLWWLFPFFQLQPLASKVETYHSQYISKTSKYV